MVYLNVLRSWLLVQGKKSLGADAKNDQLLLTPTFLRDLDVSRGRV